MDYTAFCKNYFAVTNIPVSLMEKNEAVYFAIGELLSLKPAHFTEFFWEFPFDAPNPAFCHYSPDIEYGCVHVEGTDYRIILGPSFSIPVTEEIVRTYMYENTISLEYREAVTEFLYSIPLISHQQFSRHLSLLHMSLNQKEAKPDDFFEQNIENTRKREEQYLQKIIENLEDTDLANSYHAEQKLFQHIKNGNVKTLEDYLLSDIMNFNEGKLANTPLRHAKNLFILSVAKAGIMGAIPGGVTVERTYQLINLYIQECEQLQSIEAIKSLQYAMLKDFCRRAGEMHIPDGISFEVYQCINYIRNNTNNSISNGDVAGHIHRSVSYTMKLFKEELGINIGSFITRCKLEESRSLLTYSTKSLAEISSYLCFSSQAYFQNVFKKQYRITPMQYRKKGENKHYKPFEAADKRN